MPRRARPRCARTSAAQLVEECLQLCAGAAVDDRVHARARLAGKRGGMAVRIDLEETAGLITDTRGDYVALDDALTALSQIDERKGRVVELRFFGGLSVEETAQAVRVSADTVMRDWQFAKAWLQREMRGGDAAP